MKKFLLITTIAFATIAAAPANSKERAMAEAKSDVSAQQASDVGPAPKTAAAGEEKKICKLLPSTGTRISQSACLTAKEWKRLESDLESDSY